MTKIEISTANLDKDRQDEILDKLEGLKTNKGDEIVWHGNLLDAKITFIIPEIPIACNDVQLKIPETQLIYVLTSNTVNIVSHFHIAKPIEIWFPLVLPDMLSRIHDEYIEAVMKEKEYVTRDSSVH